MKVKKLISAILACVMVMTISAPQVFAAEKPQNINQAGQTETFFDDFSGDALDTGKWLVAEKMWGFRRGLSGKRKIRLPPLPRWKRGGDLPAAAGCGGVKNV